MPKQEKRDLVVHCEHSKYFSAFKSISVSHMAHLTFFFLSTPTCTSQEYCLLLWVCVCGWVLVFTACTYICFTICAHICGFFGENEGLAFLQEECLLEVFTADSYFLRTVGCRKLKLSTSQWKEMNPIGVFWRSERSEGVWYWGRLEE